MTEQPTAERSIFLSAIEAGSPAERAAYLDRACGGDGRLRAGVEELLAAHDRLGAGAPPATAGYSPGAAGGAAAAGETASGPEAGVVIAGRYKLLEPIGEGGMGTVWLAEQTEPVRRKVAVKLIKPGMDSRQVLARFDAERQALALMDHPNIAKVHDAGATPDGRPYFVMELVKGIPITKYCDDHHLTPRQRLELFVSVCAAVQHAHQKGVIHRDLKPSNVLVAPYDGWPVVKVIDFGVAKAAGQPLTEKTLFTGLGAVVGTPEYMSPEQAELNNADVDTRSDVFSLGVLLYELLTGSTPLTHNRLKAAAILEVLRLVREEEPPRPSIRLSTAEGLPSIAACRGLEPRKLSGVVRGELDWIVMKALEKDRGRRYETAGAFAADVRWYLADEPVQACPPSKAYRLRKFVRRNRAAVLSGAAIAAALVVGLVAASVGLLEARRQARIARAEVARADRTLALMYNAEAKGNSKEAERLARKSLATCKELFGEDHPDVCESLHTLAFVLVKTKPEEAISLERGSIAIRRKYAVDDKHPHLAFSLDTLAGLLLGKGEAAEAESLYREALPMWRGFVGNDHVYVANTLDHLASALSKQGKHAEAESCMRECLAIRGRLVGDRDPSTIRARNSLIDLLKKQGKDAEAKKLSG